VIKNNVPLVLSVTSGKGGVGKTNISVNLAYQLALSGYRVLLLDADLGLANVDILLGVAPEKNLFHLLHQNATIDDVLLRTEYGFSILPSASGISEMLTLSTGQKLELLDALDPLDETVDVLIVDTGAGINDNVLYFNIAVQERIVVLTPEPTSLTDAYALIKVLKLEHGVERFRVIVNMARNAQDAKNVFSKLHNACDHFMSGVSLDLLGFIPRDDKVRTAVIRQIPFSHLDAKSPASLKIKELAHCVAGLDVDRELDGNIKFFWKKLLFRE
jgi:flagellar biosynthesis protein FlhG